MWFLVLVLTSSKVYNLWPGHASPLQTAVRQIMFVAQKCFVATTLYNVHQMCSTVDSTAKCVLWRPAEIMWGWVAVVANVPLFNIEQ